MLKLDSTANDSVNALPDERGVRAYHWPRQGSFNGSAWRSTPDGRYRTRPMPEEEGELAYDSQWPALFPSPLCIVTTATGKSVAIEKVVGASIVNRFPYILALSFCRTALSARHYERRVFLDMAQSSGHVAVQFLMPGPALDQVMAAIAGIPESDMNGRFAAAGLRTRPARHGGAPILEDAYLVYEGKLVEPGRDFGGQIVNSSPSIDVGSHRILLFEIQSIALRDDIAAGKTKIHWRSLPTWQAPPAIVPSGSDERRRRRAEHLADAGYVKSYRPDYVFPSANTVAFEADDRDDGFAVKHLPPLPKDQVEVDNDRARWPCFFPSSLGMITVEDGGNGANGFACGSTAIVARQPFTIAICVSYARINQRYAPRASVEMLRRAGRFGCGVPFYRQDVLDAIAYLGNVSHRSDPDKLANCGLATERFGNSLAFSDLPVNFDCRIVADIPLGTHAMFLGEVENIFVRREVSTQTPLVWCPWAGQEAP